jgi:hypothetical protein
VLAGVGFSFGWILAANRVQLRTADIAHDVPGIPFAVDAEANQAKPYGTHRG